jgi:hypothetical protein
MYVQIPGHFPGLDTVRSLSFSHTIGVWLWWVIRIRLSSSSFATGRWYPVLPALEKIIITFIIIIKFTLVVLITMSS